MMEWCRQRRVGAPLPSSKSKEKKRKGKEGNVRKCESNYHSTLQLCKPKEMMIGKMGTYLEHNPPSSSPHRIRETYNQMKFSLSQGALNIREIDV